VIHSIDATPRKGSYLIESSHGKAFTKESFGICFKEKYIESGGRNPRMACASSALSSSRGRRREPSAYGSGWLDRYFTQLLSFARRHPSSLGGTGDQTTLIADAIALHRGGEAVA
ncbi:MAG: hypothetical protein ACT6U0_25030, partial [Shinella sp.]